MKRIKQFFKTNPALAWFGLANLVAAIFLLLLAQTDDRLLHGISVWIKPAKFHLTVVFYVWTMVVLLQYLPKPKHISTITKYIMLCMTVEVALIDLQAARGVASHFNQASIPDALVYGAMGIFIMLNTFVAVYAARLFFKEPVQLSAALLWGIRLGLIIFVIGSLEGGVMSAVNQHSVGTTDDAAGIFFLNWNKEGGDLRIAHFLGIHALQVIPLFAWLLEKYLRKDSVKTVIAFSVLYAALFTGLLVHALMGRPLF
jgi:hypothetical protein